jgi:predicted transporter
LLRKVVAGLTILLGLYFVVRAVVELFVIDVNDPASYRNDWGGPSLVGVLAIHCGPGLLALIAFCIVLLRRRQVAARGAGI